MKTFKNTIIIAGIIVALISLKATAAVPNGTEKTAAEKKAMFESMGINKELEINLITEYLKEQKIVRVEQPVKIVKIYNAKDELIFEGEAENEKAIILKLSADFLVEYDHITYYRVNN